MKQRPLGRTNLRVSALSLGTVELGTDYGIPASGHFERPAERDAIRLVHAAVDAGISLIDTARAYGTSEQIIGRAIAGRRDQVLLATKVSLHDRGGRVYADDAMARHMLTELDASLHALNTEHVDIWQIHNVDRAVLAQSEVLDQVKQDAKNSGKARFFGGSFYGDQLPAEAFDFGLFDTMQVTYSVLDQRLADSFFAEAAEQGVGVLVRSVLLKGALTERADFLPDRLEALRERSREFRGLVADSGLGLDAAQTAVAFALAETRISTALVGVRTEEELQDNLRACDVELGQALLEKLYNMRLDDADLLNPATWNID